jgi:ATP-dependent 26S proteasome regulatory subunit
VIGIPDAAGRREMLEIHTRGMSLAARRRDSVSGGGDASTRRVGAINRVDMLDMALLGAGRRFPKMSISIEIARRTKEFSGADVENLMRDAAVPAVRDQITETVLADLDTPILIRAAHFARCI